MLNRSLWMGFLLSFVSGWTHAAVPADARAVARAKTLKRGTEVYIPSRQVAGTLVAASPGDQAQGRVAVLSKDGQKIVMPSTDVATRLKSGGSWKSGQTALLPNGQRAEVLRLFEGDFVELKRADKKVVFAPAAALKHGR